MASYAAQYVVSATLAAGAPDTITLSGLTGDRVSYYVVVENLAADGGPDLWVRADGSGAVVAAVDNVRVVPGGFEVVRAVPGGSGATVVSVVGNGNTYQVRLG